MNYPPSPPWKLPCPEPGCPWYVLVNNRGARGNDPGSGVEAANLRDDHMARCHPPADLSVVEGQHTKGPPT